jgi:hypothetical protein
MTIIAKLNEQQEATLKQVKKLGYLTGQEANNKPSQIALGLDMLQNIMNNLSKEEFLKLISNGN